MEGRLIVLECEGCPVALGVGAVTEMVPLESAASLGDDLVRVSLSDLTGAPPPHAAPTTRLLARLGETSPPIALEAESCLGIRTARPCPATPIPTSDGRPLGWFQEHAGRRELTLDTATVIRRLREQVQ